MKYIWSCFDFDMPGSYGSILPQEWQNLLIEYVKFTSMLNKST